LYGLKCCGIQGDIEYKDDYTGGRFDAIAAHWPSSSSSRKNKTNIGLSLIEMKYADVSLTGSSGLYNHCLDASAFLSNNSNINTLKDEMREIFNQKLELGLIKNQNSIESFNNNNPEYILIFVNHKPASTVLKRELKKVSNMLKTQKLNLKIATSTFMGYGLYKKSIYTLDDFLVKFDQQLLV
jgi:hypothetical protein